MKPPHSECNISSLRSLLFRGQLFKEEGIIQLFSKYIDTNKTHFDEIEQKLAFISTDRSTGETVLINHGEILLGALASNAFPGVINMRTVFGRKLYDGDFSRSIALNDLKQLGMDKILTVSANGNVPLGLINRISTEISKHFQKVNISKDEEKPHYEFVYDAQLVGPVEFWKVPELRQQVYLQCLEQEEEILTALF